MGRAVSCRFIPPAPSARPYARSPNGPQHGFALHRARDDRVSTRTYSTVFLSRYRGAAKKETTPSQPTRFTAAYRQKYRWMHGRQRKPVMCSSRLVTSIPMFMEKDTKSVAVEAPHALHLATNGTLSMAFRFLIHWFR